MTATAARDLHVGDLWHYRAEFDLHVTQVITDDGGTTTTVVVVEYQFPLHVAADAVLDVDTPTTSPNGATA